MADVRSPEAVRRLERAVARIEAAVARRDVPAGTADDSARLREAHDVLRRKVAGAIGQIDRIIESGKRG